METLLKKPVTSQTNNKPSFLYPLLLCLIVVFISLLHYITPTGKQYLHDLLRRLYYIPLFLALYRFGLKGGLLFAVLITVAYLPHFFIQHGGFHHVNLNTAKILEIVFLYIMALLFGSLQNRLIHTNKKLDKSNISLRQKTVQLIEAEKAVRVSERVKTIADLTAGLAHEIKNPLAALSGAAEICKKESSGKMEHFADIITEEAGRLNAILNTFLAFTRKQETNQVTVNLWEAVNHAAELVKIISKDISITMKNNLPGTVLIKESEGAIVQAVFNLIKNALEAVPEKGGQIILHSFQKEEKTYIQVKDNGPGPQTEEDPMAPFVTSKASGTGLGLPIVYRICDSLGGKLRWFRDESWTVFEITIPFKTKEGLL